jgi:RNA ligase
MKSQMTEIEAIQYLQDLVRGDFENWSDLGHIYTYAQDGLVIFNYTARAYYDADWNVYERVCRGLILDARSGALVGLPFPKFFNWNEGGRNTKAHLVETTAKIDGSLGVCYWHPHLKEFRIATRGRFDSDQAQWATDYLHTRYPQFCQEWDHALTALFEIVYPENRVVLNYGRKESLVLLGVRSTETHADPFYLPDLLRWAHSFDLELPDYYAFNSWKEILDARDQLDYDAEGFVARFADGQRFKFKGDAYLRAQKLMTEMTIKTVLNEIQNGTLELTLAAVPEDFHGPTRALEAQIEQTVDATRARIRAAYQSAPKTSRKAFALWVEAHAKDDAPYLFALWDGKRLLPMIYDREF